MARPALAEELSDKGLTISAANHGYIAGPKREAAVGLHLACWHPAVKPRKLLTRLATGQIQNVRFVDMVDLAEAFGFELKRTSGSHHIFAHPKIPTLLNLQEDRGEAKPNQIRQFLRIIETYSLEMEDRS